MGESTLVRYEPSGRVGGQALVALPVALAAACAVGFGYQWLLDHNALIVLDVLLPFLLGGALGLVAILGLRFGHVRSTLVARLFGIALVAVGYAASWLFALGVDEGGFAAVTEAWRLRWSEGRPLPGQPGTVAPPSLLLFSWLFEALFTWLPALILPLAWWGRAVYCEDAGRYVRRERLGMAYGPSPFAVREAARDRGLPGLLTLGLRSYAENETEGELRFFVHRTRQGQQAYLTITWAGKLDSPRGRKVARDVLVLRRVRVDDAFLRELRTSLKLAA